MKPGKVLASGTRDACGIGMTFTRGVVVVVSALLVAGVAHLALPQSALAWKPGGHYVLSEKVQRDMEPGAIKDAMAANPDMAYAWGSYGADVAYGDLRAPIGYVPYADLFHYQKVGTFAKTLLQNAIASGRTDQIAYAAGWITHACGDMYVHQDLVNPNAGGVFFDKPGTVDMHRKIETWADTVMWVDYGGKSASSFTSYTFPARYNRSMPLGLCSTFANTVKQVYEVSPSNSLAGYVFGTVKSDATIDGDDFESMTDKVFTVMSFKDLASHAGLYASLSSSKSGLASRGITEAQVFAAADKGAAMATWLLDCAQRQDYSAFLDTWNLDVGPGRPDALNTLTVQVETGSGTFAGTNSDVDFWFADKAPDGAQLHGVQYPLDHEGYDDFERNDRDVYYLYTNPAAPIAGMPSPADVGHIGLYARNGDDWEPRRVMVWCNGVLVQPGVGPGKTLGDSWWIYPSLSSAASSHLNWSAAVKYPSRPVPNLVGLTTAKAATMLSAATYYNMGTQTIVDCGQPEGTIVEQTPTAYSSPGFGATVATYVSNGRGPAFTTVKATTLAPSQGTSVTVSCQLTAGGVPSPARAIHLQRATRTKFVWWDPRTWFGGWTWTSFAWPTTDAAGRASVAFASPLAETRYRLLFQSPGTTFYTTSSVLIIKPKALVSAPTVKRVGTRTYTVSARLWPKHTDGTTEVTLTRYRRVRGTWRKYSTIRMTARGLSSDGLASLCSVKIKFPYSGTWRVRATHPTDASNTSYTSGYRTFVVK